MTLPESFEQATARNGGAAQTGTTPELRFERPTVSRARIASSGTALIEDLNFLGCRSGRSPEAFCTDYQICLPYRGLFVWHVGRDDVVGDSTQVVLVRGGESYRMSTPVAHGYSELILTPDLEALAEIAHGKGTCLSDHPLFRQRTSLADPKVLTLRSRLLHLAAGRVGTEALEAEELALAVIREAVQRVQPSTTHADARTVRLINRAKEYLAAEYHNRVTLDGVARAAGASPAYLTHIFHRVAGMSLHRYLTRLRLSHAVVELPHASDLTRLALDLGFSSHSHFAAVFRRVFACTPSEFRRDVRAHVHAGRMFLVTDHPGRR
jgi:AraC family transcriptional regulator